MYLAPLNYDRFFKKVFSDLDIAKQFLEDFFDKTIEEIEFLPSRNKITDSAAAVEFDFRCKIDGTYCIIDMQQWYKTDVVKRFYLYFCLGSSLQLERIEEKSVPLNDNLKKTTPNYHHIEPNITLIWMSDDTLGFVQDFIAYTPTPEMLIDFMKNPALWTIENFAVLLAQRDEVLSVLNNDTKGLGFLQKNRMIYAFQSNIVKNKKLTKYFHWFEFAQKTKNIDNTKEDFEEYQKNDVMAAITKRLSKEELEAHDIQYIDDYDKFKIELERYNEAIRDEGRQEGEQMGIVKERRNSIRKVLKTGRFPCAEIAEMFGVSIEEVETIQKEM